MLRRPLHLKFVAPVAAAMVIAGGILAPGVSARPKCPPGFSPLEKKYCEHHPPRHHHDSDGAEYDSGGVGF